MSPSGAAPAYRPDLADGTLDVRLVDGSQPLARTRLIAAVLLGTLGRCRVYRTWSATSLRIASPSGGPVPLCLDGEATEIDAGDQPGQAAEEAAGLPPARGRMTGESQSQLEVAMVTRTSPAAPPAARPASRPGRAAAVRPGHGLAGPGRRSSRAA